MRDLKFRLRDATLVSDVNQTLSNLLSQVAKTNKDVAVVSNRVNNNTKIINQINQTGPPSVLPPGTPIALTGWNKWTVTPDLTPIAGTAFQMFPQGSIINYPATWCVSFYVHTGVVPVTSMTLARTKPGSLEVLDFLPITFNGQASVNVNSNTLVTSDVMSLQIDADHDYWFLMYGYPGGPPYWVTGSNGNPNLYGGYMVAVVDDLTKTSPIQNPPSVSGVLSQWIVSWEAQTFAVPQAASVFLMAAWEMLEGTGSIAADSSTFAPNSLTLTGETWGAGTSPLTEKLTFAGGGGGVAATDANTNFGNTQPFSVSIWFDTSNVSSEVTLVGTLNPSGNFQGWEVNLNGFGNTGDISVLLISNYPSNLVRVTVPFSASTLYHLVFTYDGSSAAGGVKVYLNGSPISTTIQINTLSSTIAGGVPVYVAERQDASNKYSGDVGPLYIWDRVLSAGEVTALYASPYSPPA